MYLCKFPVQDLRSFQFFVYKTPTCIPKSYSSLSSVLSPASQLLLLLLPAYPRLRICSLTSEQKSTCATNSGVCQTRSLSLFALPQSLRTPFVVGLPCVFIFSTPLPCSIAPTATNPHVPAPRCNDIECNQICMCLRIPGRRDQLISLPNLGKSPDYIPCSGYCRQTCVC